MSIDYQIIAYRDVADISRVDLLVDAVVPTLDIRGSNFSDVAEVEVNQIATQEFFVQSSTRLLVEVPEELTGVAINTISVLRASFGNSSRSLIRLQASVGGRRAEGSTRLVQTFLKLLLTTPGTDSFSKEQGGGLLNLVGTAVNPSMLSASSATSVATTETQMIQAQAGDSSLSPDERLRSATLLSANFNPRTTSLSLRIRLTAVDGSSSEVPLSL